MHITSCLNIFKCIGSCTSSLKFVKILFSTDMWMSCTMDSYMSMKVNFIDAEWELQCVNLGTIPFHEDHMETSIVQGVWDILEQWNLSLTFKQPLRQTNWYDIKSGPLFILACTEMLQYLMLSVKGCVTQGSLQHLVFCSIVLLQQG